MSPAYIDAISTHLPHAKIVFDQDKPLASEIKSSSSSKSWPSTSQSTL